MVQAEPLEFKISLNQNCGPIYTPIWNIWRFPKHQYKRTALYWIGPIQMLFRIQDRDTMNALHVLHC